ncbi:MAG: hypothetical protein COA79_10265 [Planctomycetota bacterium]|nr:MAG: hypothetical protein COA79_10265 [Planctomycetota bacterium]
MHRFILSLLLLLSIPFVFAQEETKEQKVEKWKESRIKESKQGWYFPFEVDADVNGFPDNWKRSENRYMPDGITLIYRNSATIKLDSKEKKAGRHSLFILHQGVGVISLETDVFNIDNFAAYEISSWFNLDQVSASRTQLQMGVLWYDKDRKQLPEKTEDSFLVKHTQGWEKFKLRINLLNEKAKYTKLYIRVDGNDKNGKVWIDEVRFYKRPRIIIETKRDFNIYNEKDPFKINVTIKGLEKDKYFLDIEMIDSFKVKNFNVTQEINLANLDSSNRKVHTFNITPVSKFSLLDTQRPERSYFVKGIFDVEIILRDDKEEIGGNSIKIARTKIYERTPIPNDGEIFGVTLSNLDMSFKIRKGLKLLGLHLVKVPVWGKDLKVIDRLLINNQAKQTIANVLKSIKTGASQPQVIGIFHPRPDELKDLAEVGILNLVNADEKKWYPYFRGAWESFGPRVKAWQFGSDNDSSFTNDAKQLTALDKLLALREGQLSVGVATQILEGTLSGEKELLRHDSIKFFNFNYHNKLDFDKLMQVMSKQEEKVIHEKWITLPLKASRESGNELVSAIELFKRVVYCRKNNITKIFTSPYQGEFEGLINLKNEPTPSFLSYKLGVDYLSEVSYIGSLSEFGDDVENFVFSLKKDPKKAILVAWTKRSDQKVLSYQFSSDKLVKVGNKLKDLYQEFKKPDKMFNHNLLDFFPDLNTEISRNHLIKGLNKIILDKKIRASFLKKYDLLESLSKSPLIRSQLKNKYKTEEEKKQLTRYILEELYPVSLSPIEVVQKNILLDQEVVRVDILGNESPETIKYSKGDRVPFQEIKIDQYPVIFTGLNRAFINTRISIHFDEKDKIYSRLERQTLHIKIKNHYDQRMKGIFVITLPQAWNNFSPFIPFSLEKGKSGNYAIRFIPSRIAEPGPIEISLKTTFTTNQKYVFKSKYVVNLESDLIVGRKGEKIEILPPRFGIGVKKGKKGKHTLKIPVSLKNIPENVGKEVDVVVTLNLPGERPRPKRIPKIKVGAFLSETFQILIKKSYKNKKARIRIEQVGSNTSSIYYNLTVPIPDE